MEVSLQRVERDRDSQETEASRGSSREVGRISRVV